jgi:hypothetical protein
MLLKAAHRSCRRASQAYWERVEQHQIRPHRVHQYSREAGSSADWPTDLGLQPSARTRRRPIGHRSGACDRRWCKRVTSGGCYHPATPTPARAAMLGRAHCGRSGDHSGCLREAMSGTGPHFKDFCRARARRSSMGLRWSFNGYWSRLCERTVSP